VLRVQPPAETHRVSAVPFCAYENTQQTSGNTGDSLEMIAGIHLELCLFVPTKIPVFVCKFLKRFGVPFNRIFEHLDVTIAEATPLYELCSGVLQAVSK
jgi:hypothetical protein